MHGRVRRLINIYIHVTTEYCIYRYMLSLARRTFWPFYFWSFSLGRPNDVSPLASPRASSVTLQGKSPVTVTVHPKPDSPPRPPVQPPNGVLHRYVAPPVRSTGQDTRVDHSDSAQSLGDSFSSFQQPTPTPSPRNTTTTTAEIHNYKVQ